MRHLFARIQITFRYLVTFIPQILILCFHPFTTLKQRLFEFTFN